MEYMPATKRIPRRCVTNITSTSIPLHSTQTITFSSYKQISILIITLHYLHDTQANKENSRVNNKCEKKWMTNIKYSPFISDVYYYFVALICSCACYVIT